MNNLKILTTEENLSYTLSALYDGAGFSRFRMSKFEEYSLYLENKNFLSSEAVITFNDVDGKLLALKPDVTLSIVKSVGEKFSGVKKLYYNENVYRPDKNGGRFKEIGQIGLEAIGQIDDYTMFEVVSLAIKSLSEIDDNYVLDIGNIGFITAFLEGLNLNSDNCKKIIECISGKNLDELMRLSAEFGVGDNDRKILKKMITANGDFAANLKVAESLVVNDNMQAAVQELERLYKALSATGCQDKIRLDFSIINDISYYNDIVFQGYVSRVPRAVLSGGRYDSLAQKFNAEVQAVGFAVYLNEVGAYYQVLRKNDFDVAVLYDKTADTVKLYEAVEKLKVQNLSVAVVSVLSDNLRYGKILSFEDGSLTEVKNA